MITPARLRAIAVRIESLCWETRKLRRNTEYTPCDGCRRAAEELRELAEQSGPRPSAPSRFFVDSTEPEPSFAAPPDQHGMEAEGRTNR